ncbi:hypothetical protein LCGC14_0883950 [marine sediment metagenome]|uniref:YkgJ family cysteine cluster protein n=1 Tax=marine sediment metagenome TaxID=412755 RepID=A0A0F9S841_9ZZZZ
MEKYELMRNKIDEIKKEEGFKCLKCGDCCHGLKNPISELDYIYMKENGVDLDGIEIEDTLFSRRNLKIIDNHCFYYEENSKTCKIHPYNPMLCWTYPFVVNLNSTTFAFKPCLREQEIRRKYITPELKKILNDLYLLEFGESQ